MKDQYVGDISDFEKYSVLRALSAASRLPLAVCWMLTPPDATREGNRLQYLAEPARYRHLNPHVYDQLGKIMASGRRSVAAVEQAGLLEGATFFGHPLNDHESSRLRYFREVWEALTEDALVFFDPDIGLAGTRIRKGRSRSSMYVFDDEVSEGFRRGHSLVIFDHWRRVQRLPYLRDVFSRIRRLTDGCRPFALWSSRVAFLIIPQERHAETLMDAARALGAQWSPELKFTDQSSSRPSASVAPDSLRAARRWKSRA